MAYVVVSARSRGKIVMNRIFTVPADLPMAEKLAIAERAAEYAAREGIVRLFEAKFATGTEVWAGEFDGRVRQVELDLSGFDKLCLTARSDFKEKAAKLTVELPGDDA